MAGIQRDLSDHPQQVMKENVDRVIQFMAGKRIKMLHITNKDVLEGNLKSIMRMILALAAHYKPQSVRCPQHNQSNKDQNIQVGAGLSQQEHSKEEASKGSDLKINEHRSGSFSSADGSVTGIRKSEKNISKVPIRLQSYQGNVSRILFCITL